MKNQITVDQEMAVLTRAGTSFGIRLLEKLAEAGIKPAIIIVEHTPFTKRWKMAKFLARKIGFADALRYNLKFWTPLLIRKLTLGRYKKLPDYSRYADHVVKVKDINENRAVKALIQFGVKKIVLAQSGIIKKPILSIEGLWIINCHPGKLPYYRGVDVIRWALYERQPVEVTLHLVDSGVDTGEILESREVKIAETDSISDVESRAINLSIDMLSDAACKGPTAYPIKRKNDRQAGKQYYLMPFKHAKRLQKQWNDIRDQYIKGQS
jgi:methionyl-tRNA formyltransferase